MNRMHTYEAKLFRFHHDGDFSGEVICVEKATKKETAIPAEDLLELIANAYVLPKKIEKLEQATPEQLLLG